MKNKLLFFSFIIVLTSCSSLMKYKWSKDKYKNAEFEKKVVIVEAEDPKDEAVSGGTTVKLDVPAGDTTVSATKTLTKTNPKTVKKDKNTVAKTEPVPVKRQPEIEDSEGFDGQRRPLADPFRVGESVIHEVTYLGATAGELSFQVKPYAIVNNRKSYNFFIDIQSSSFFSRMFAVDDQVQTFVDFETLVPHVFKLNIRDSAQVKEAQSYFDVENLRADYWEHRYTEKGGHEEKKRSWTILPFSQNPFSAIFYMRVFKWTVGKEYIFRVADDEKNVAFKGKAVEKTILDTEAGEFKAIKIKAEVYSRGNLAKATDFFLWVSDDDRKYILRIEVKLPIGSLVSEAIKIKEGKKP